LRGANGPLLRRIKMPLAPRQGAYLSVDNLIGRSPTSGLKRNAEVNLVVRLPGGFLVQRVKTWGGKRPGAGRPKKCGCGTCPPKRRISCG